MDALPDATRLEPGSRLVIATHNAGKLREIAALLAPYAVDRGLGRRARPAGAGGGRARFRRQRADQGARRRQRRAARRWPTISASAWPHWAARRACIPRAGPGPARISPRRCSACTSELGGAADRRAWFICALCLAWPDGQTATFLGRVDGTLVWPPRGDRGFGYDPMFVPAGGHETYGEMDQSQKHATSHRALAMAQFFKSCLLA